VIVDDLDAVEKALLDLGATSTTTSPVRLFASCPIPRGTPSASA
jgi:hypothetical protein